MRPSVARLLMVLLSLLLVLPGCNVLSRGGGGGGGDDDDDDSAADDDDSTDPQGTPNDLDGDTIFNTDEGGDNVDTDGDGTPDKQDWD